ncbi:MAG TPA: hypothetical protein VF590_27020, partial [Isosphaeraceae bacterium]
MSATGTSGAIGGRPAAAGPRSPARGDQARLVVGRGAHAGGPGLDRLQVGPVERLARPAAGPLLGPVLQDAPRPLAGQERRPEPLQHQGGQRVARQPGADAVGPRAAEQPRPLQRGEQAGQGLPAVGVAGLQRGAGPPLGRPVGRGVELQDVQRQPVAGAGAGQRGELAAEELAQAAEPRGLVEREAEGPLPLGVGPGGVPHRPEQYLEDRGDLRVGVGAEVVGDVLGQADGDRQAIGRGGPAVTGGALDGLDDAPRVEGPQGAAGAFDRGRGGRGLDGVEPLAAERQDQAAGRAAARGDERRAERREQLGDLG